MIHESSNSHHVIGPGAHGKHDFGALTRKMWTGILFPSDLEYQRASINQDW